MSKKEVLNLFIDKPYTLRMGSKLIAQRYKVSLNIVKEARALYHQMKSTQVSNSPKILIVDIETSPLRAYVWSRWKQNIYLDQTIAEWFMICWAAKWVGEENVISGKLISAEILREDDKRITQDLWVLLDQADIVIAHNGKKFDIPKMNSRFILNNLPPTSPYKQIDTKEVAAKQFGFSSNKLDALATYFGIENKDDTDFELWVRCLNGEQEAIDYMSKYCDKDVLILERVYIKLRPWIKNHPNVGLYTNANTPICPHCGSSHLEENHKDFTYTPTNKYKTMRCLDCGAISRVGKSIISKDKKAKLLTSI